MSSLRLAAPALAFVALTLGPSAHAEQVFWSTRDLLKSFFQSSERVHFVEIHPAEAGAALRQQLGYLPSKEKYVVFVATTQDKVDGFAVIDEEKGEHEPITFGVKLDAAGRVQRMEIMAYRERYGSEVRQERFRTQFVGRSTLDPIRAGEDITAVSGATISSKAMAMGVKRAIALVAMARAAMSESADHALGRGRGAPAVATRSAQH